MKRSYVELLTGDKHNFAIHKKGCRDLKRGAVVDAYCFDTDDLEGYIASEVQHYRDQDQGWERCDWRVHECCKTAPIADNQRP